MCTLRKTSRESKNDDFFLEKRAHSRPAATARAKANIQLKPEPPRSRLPGGCHGLGGDCDTVGPGPGLVWAAFGAGGWWVTKGGRWGGRGVRSALRGPGNFCRNGRVFLGCSPTLSRRQRL